MEIPLTNSTTAMSIVVWGRLSAEIPDPKKRQEAVLSILMRSMLWRCCL